MNRPPNDSADLEALFDSIALEANNPTAERPAKGVARNQENSDVINKIGHLTRLLHDSLRELGVDKNLEKVAHTMPDARDRLNYIAVMSQKAAEKVLNATDTAQPEMAIIEAQALYLSTEWDKMFNKELGVAQFKVLAKNTHAFLQKVPQQTRVASASLNEIMMAQDFQDLTGQVIKSIVDMTQGIEQQLLSLLLENAPPAIQRSAAGISGPQIHAGNQEGWCSSQAQVDELLESLGY